MANLGNGVELWVSCFRTLCRSRSIAVAALSKCNHARRCFRNQIIKSFQTLRIAWTMSWAEQNKRKAIKKSPDLTCKLHIKISTPKLARIALISVILWNLTWNSLLIQWQNFLQSFFLKTKPCLSDSHLVASDLLPLDSSAGTTQVCQCARIKGTSGPVCDRLCSARLQQRETELSA